MPETPNTSALGAALASISRATSERAIQTGRTNVEEFKGATAQALESVSNVANEALSTGNPILADIAAKSGLFPKEAGESLKEQAAQIRMAQAAAPPAQPTADPERITPEVVRDVRARLKAESERGLFEFDNPWEEFFLPMLLGVAPGSIIAAKQQRRFKAQEVLRKDELVSDWYRAYDDRIDAGEAHADALREVTAEFGFMAPGANSLASPNAVERDSQFLRGFLQKMQDPTRRKEFEAITDPRQRELSSIMSAFIEQIRETSWVPEELWETFRIITGFKEPKLSPETQQELDILGVPSIMATAQQKRTAQITGELAPEVRRVLVKELKVKPSEATARDIRAAELILEERGLSKVGREVVTRGLAEERVAGVTAEDRQEREANLAAAKREAVIRKEFGLEPERPITGEQRGKFAIPSRIKTLGELADAGVRFATEADRKIYATLRPVRSDIQELESTLFDTKKGVFKGLQRNTAVRFLQKGGLIAAKFQGTDKGENIRFYNDILASMARRLIALAGETGGRFTDVDVKQIMKSAPSLGGILAPPDSESLARKKFERFLRQLDERLDDVLDTTTIGLQQGRGEPTIIKRKPGETVNEYIKRTQGGR